MPFTKGQSGNPGGRPKKDCQVIALAKAHGAEAVRKLITLMRGRDSHVALKAATALLDRAYGKSARAIEILDPEPLLPPVINISFKNGGPGSDPRTETSERQADGDELI